MSYILDALRRAEADRERERGHVPGLHAQPSAGGAAAAGAAVSPRRWWPWVGGGVLLLLAGVGAGSWWASSSPADLPVTPQSHAAPALQPERRAEAVPIPQAQPLISGAPAVPPPSSVPAAAPTAPLTAPSPIAALPIAALPIAPAKPQAVAPAVTAVAEAPPIPRLAELPESIRRELPKLAISGSVYSEDPASRFLIANGEVMREGAKLGPDHVLEQIGARELVLRFKGQRYRQAL